MYTGSNNKNFLGLILIIIGSLLLFIALGSFIFRLAIALFGLYLIYNGLLLRNQQQQIFFLFSRFGNRFRRH